MSPVPPPTNEQGYSVEVGAAPDNLGEYQWAGEISHCEWCCASADVETAWLDPLGLCMLR